jgi:hypothetical protein
LSTRVRGAPRGNPWEPDSSRARREARQRSRGGSHRDTPAGWILLASGSAEFLRATLWWRGSVRSGRCTLDRAVPTADWPALRYAPPYLGGPPVIPWTSARPSFAISAPLRPTGHSPARTPRRTLWWGRMTYSPAVESGKTGRGVSTLPSRLYSRLTGWWSEPMLSGGLWSRSEEFGAWLLRLRECGGRGGPWIS